MRFISSKGRREREISVLKAEKAGLRKQVKTLTRANNFLLAENDELRASVKEISSANDLLQAKALRQSAELRRLRYFNAEGINCTGIEWTSGPDSTPAWPL